MNLLKVFFKLYNFPHLLSGALDILLWQICDREKDSSTKHPRACSVANPENSILKIGSKALSSKLRFHFQAYPSFQYIPI